MLRWTTERDGVFFLLSDEDMMTGDYFVFLKPDDRNVILFSSETLKYSAVCSAKLLFCYDINKRTLKELVSESILYKVFKFND